MKADNSLSDCAKADKSFSDYAKAANFYINVLSGSNNVRLSIEKDGISIFDRIFGSTEYNSLSDINEKDISLCKQDDNILCQIYSSTRGVFYSFLFNLAGDIALSCDGAKETGVAQKTTFAFKTNKTLMNNRAISFYHLAVNCNEFHNNSVLQMTSYLISANYHYNAGVIDSKSNRASVPLSLADYIQMGIIDSQRPVAPSYTYGVFDNFGAELGNNIRVLGKLSVNSAGFLNVENLFVENGSISAGQCFDVSGSLSGTVSSFNVASQTFAHIGSWQTSPMKNLKNQGNLHISQTSKLDIGSLENDGEITGAQSLEILVDTIRSGSNGVILAKDALNLIKRSKEGMSQQILVGEEAMKQFGTALGGKIKVQQHTDHYLNTITDYYKVDQFGRRTYSHQAQTGYQFTHRTTETMEKELPADTQQAIVKAMEAKGKQLEFLRASLKYLDELEKAVKGQVEATVADSDSYDDTVVDIHALRAVLKADDPRNFDHLLLSPRIYEALSSHNAVIHSMLAFMKSGGDIEKVFREQKTSLVVSKPTPQRRNSFSDVSHVAQVEKNAVGLSFESVASRLTLWRYEMERLATANPEAYRALLAAWDFRVKATMAVGAVDALTSAVPSGGASLGAYGLSLGVGLGLDYIADLVAKHGAQKAATLASGGDPKLYASYEKTFNYVGGSCRSTWRKVSC